MADPDPQREARPPIPRWVKVFAIVAVVAVLVLTVALVTGHGGPEGHGPARHMPSGESPATNVPGGDSSSGNAPAHS